LDSTLKKNSLLLSNLGLALRLLHFARWNSLRDEVSIMRNGLFLALAGLFFATVACGRAHQLDAGVFAADESGEAFVIIGSSETFLKKSTESSANLASGSEKCEIPAGKTIILQAQPEYEGNHMYVKTADLLPGCSFHNGYIFRGHIAKSSLKNLFSANMRAFLDVIAFAEGTDDRYDYIFSHATFSSFAGHPRRLICSGGYCSDAAGRYQIKSTTWDEVRRELGLTDFSPESQDRAAVQLIKWRGGFDDVERIDGPNTFDNALYTVRLEWASLPHSPYGQPIKSVGQLWEKFKQYKQRY
jgi:muramidase (phage lysozyme)